MFSTLKSIMEFIDEWEGHPYDAFFQVIEELSEIPEQSWVVIKEVLIYPYRVGDKEQEAKEISEDELSRYTYRYKAFITELVNSIAMKDEAEDNFYQDLYAHVFESDILPEDNTHKAFYLFLLSEIIQLVPYYSAVNLLKLEDAEIREIGKKIGPQMQRAYHMNARQFDTKTEKFSQYWEIASTLKTREEEIVFWTMVFIMEKKNDESESSS